MINRIKHLAVVFHDAIEKTISNHDVDYKYFSWFYDFPSGCCGVVSELLARYLLQNGIETTYICGTYRDGSFEDMCSHAWLVYGDNFIVDITGDQFKYNSLFLNYDKSVYVGPENDFYRLFDIDDTDCCNYSSIEKWNEIHEQNYFSLELYSKIIKNIDWN